MTEPTAWIVVDLGFGDQGKGATVDFLARDQGARAVVRFHGGAQAGHRVVTADGRAHVFSQFGAGSFVPGVRTVHTRDVLLQPWALAVEAAHLAAVGVLDAWERLWLSREALVVTPFHRAVNHLRELGRGAARHGSCGVGVGEARDDSLRSASDELLRAGDLLTPARTRRLLTATQERLRARAADLARALAGTSRRADEAIEVLEGRGWAQALDESLGVFRRRARVVPEEEALRAALGQEGGPEAGAPPRPVVFEGAQGVLLDEGWGFHPHTTWSDCTPALARAALARVGFQGRVETLGVLRAYATRHGAGPLPTEDEVLTAALPDAANGAGPWQGTFRVGWFDAVLGRYALAACAAGSPAGVDGLALTCLDRLPARPKLAVAYEVPGGRLDALPLGPRGDLAGQTALAERVFAARPLYGRVGATAGAPGPFLELVEAELGLPVRLVAHGPSAVDRVWRG